MDDLEKIEQSGLNYDKIMFDEDFIPSNIYKYQIKRRNSKIANIAESSLCALDIGCGTGFHTLELAKKFDHIISTDVSVNAVTNCKKKISEVINETQVDFIVCDGSNLPFKENSVNFTWISGVLHHIPENIPKCIEQVCKITNKQILFDEPNKVLLWNLIMKLSKADPVGNERPLDINEIIIELERNNYDKIIYSYWGFFVQSALLLHLNILVNTLEKFEKKMEKFLGKRFYLRWTITAKRKN